MNHTYAMPPCLRRGHLLVGARFPHAAALGKPPPDASPAAYGVASYGGLSSLFHHLRVGRAPMPPPPLQVVLTLSTFRSNLTELLRSPMLASTWICRISSSERHTSGQLSETWACPAEPGFSCRRERRRGVTWGRTILRHLRRWPLPIVTGGRGGEEAWQSRTLAVSSWPLGFSAAGLDTLPCSYRIAFAIDHSDSIALVSFAQFEPVVSILMISIPVHPFRDSGAKQHRQEGHNPPTHLSRDVARSPSPTLSSCLSEKLSSRRPTAAGTRSIRHVSAAATLYDAAFAMCPSSRLSFPAPLPHQSPVCLVQSAHRPACPWRTIPETRAITAACMEPRR
jgi:hypothetical protein